MRSSSMTSTWASQPSSVGFSAETDSGARPSNWESCSIALRMASGAETRSSAGSCRDEERRFSDSRPFVIITFLPFVHHRP